MKLFANVLHSVPAHTGRSYTQGWRDLARFLGSVKAIETVTTDQLVNWVKDMQSRRISPETIRRRISSISALFEDGENPTKGVYLQILSTNVPSTKSLLTFLGALRLMDEKQDFDQQAIDEANRMRSRLEFAFGSPVDDEMVVGVVCP